MGKNLVAFDDVSRTFLIGSVAITALDHATCEVRSGDQIAIMGPSGSGKSTLLALMAQLDGPTSGVVSWPAFEGTSNLRPRHIGLAFQSPSLIPSLSVIENVKVPLLILGDTDGIQARAMAVLDAVGLASIADRLPEELSGGQGQRAGVARALVTNPKLLLADEPTGQLDQTTGRTLIATLLAYSARTGAALVIATHDPAIARQMARVWTTGHGILTTIEHTSAKP